MFKSLMRFSHARGLPPQQRWVQRINHNMFSKPLGRLQLPGGVLLQKRWVSNTVEERVAKLEGELLQKRWVTIEERLAKLEGEDLASKVNGLTSKVNGLTSKANGLTSKVDGLTSKVDGLTSKVDGLTSKIDDLTTAVKGVISKNEELTAKVEGVISKNEELTAKVEGVISKNEELTAKVEGNQKDLTSIFKSTVLLLHKAVILKAVLKEIQRKDPSKVLAMQFSPYSKYLTTNQVF